MANEKISDMAEATLPLGADDIHTVVQGGVNKQVPNSAVGTLQGFSYDPDTSDLPAGILGITGGYVNNDDGSNETVNTTLDFSGESDGNYQVFIATNGDVNFASVDGINLVGAVELAMLEIVDGAIVPEELLFKPHAWAQTSVTLANLAAEKAATGTLTVIDPNNITTIEVITIDPGVTELSGSVFKHEITSSGSAGVEEFEGAASQGISAGEYIFFSVQTDPADIPTISNLGFYSLGSDTIVSIEFNVPTDEMFSVWNRLAQKMEIQYASPGVVTSTALAPVSVTVGASPYKYTNESAYNQQVIIGNVAGLSAVKFQRGAGTQYAMGLLAQQVILCPGDNVEVTYAVTTPTMIAVTFRS